MKKLSIKKKENKIGKNIKKRSNKKKKKVQTAGAAFNIKSIFEEYNTYFKAPIQDVYGFTDEFCKLGASEEKLIKEGYP